MKTTTYRTIRMDFPDGKSQYVVGLKSDGVRLLVQESEPEPLEIMPRGVDAPHGYLSAGYKLILERVQQIVAYGAIKAFVKEYVIAIEDGADWKEI